jgi:glutathione synthase/RimK-type ligase-like ATP-grasp enzyme
VVGCAVPYDRIYFLKKAYPLYPGVRRPRCAALLEPHYRARRAARAPWRAALDAVVGLAFQVWIPLRARQVRRKFGLDETWRRRAERIAHAGFADPNDLALFDIRDAADLDRYIRRFEDAALNKQINPRGWTRACALADKARFAERCREAGLPHPQTVAVLVDGELDVLSELGGRELIAKPADGEGGGGVTRLPAVRDVRELRIALAGAGAGDRGGWVVQPILRPHPEIVELALDALPTVRIVTILDEQDLAEVVSATFRCPSRPGAVVDNMKAGGLIAPVDLASGRLGEARFGYGPGVHVRHPVTGGALLGRRLPDWPAATALACAAHDRAFADYALVGWDVALTPDGPVLIEGNAKPGVLMPQRASGRGLAQGRYGQLLAHRLATSR